MELNFCRRCGKPLKNSGGHVYQCADGHTIFANSAPSVGVFFLTDDNQVILSVRGIEPRKGMLDAFGGFLDGEETLEAAVARELKEELSLQPEDYEPLTYLTSASGNYPFQGDLLPVMSALFWTRLKASKELSPSDDVADTRTIPLHDIDLAELHDEDIREGIQELRRKFPVEPSART